MACIGNNQVPIKLPKHIGQKKGRHRGDLFLY